MLYFTSSSTQTERANVFFNATWLSHLLILYLSQEWCFVESHN